MRTTAVKRRLQRLYNMVAITPEDFRMPLHCVLIHDSRRTLRVIMDYGSVVTSAQRPVD